MLIAAGVHLIARNLADNLRDGGQAKLARTAGMKVTMVEVIGD